jgi:hypothetical protein
MAGVKSRVCRKLFRKFDILPLASEFILCLLSFVAENLNKFQRNTDVHNLNTRRKYDLHMPNTNLAKYKKGVYYTGIKLFNNLPLCIKRLPLNSLLLLCRWFYLCWKFLSFVYIYMCDKFFVLILKILKFMIIYMWN